MNQPHPPPSPPPQPWPWPDGEPALPAGALRAGWTWGRIIGSQEWLTVRGSAYVAPPLHPRPGDAGPGPDGAYCGPRLPGDWTRPVLAYVAEMEHTGMTGPRAVAYRILARICCDMHNRNCEPPSELCCWECTEAGHNGPGPHPDGTACVLAGQPT